MVVTSLFSYFKNEPDIMTVPEAAKALRCGKNTIYDLIKEGKLNLTEIAIQCGFNSSSYFCKVFKSLTGYTPSEFAAKGRKLG